MFVILACVEVVLTGGKESDSFGTAQCPCTCHKKLSTGPSTNSRSASLQHCRSCALKASSMASFTLLHNWLSDLYNI